MMEFLYVFCVLLALWYFETLYKVKPWNANCCNREFRYRIKKTSKVYKSTRESKYVIYRKYSCFFPWFIVRKDIKDAKEAAKILVGLKESDEKDSFKEKNEWLNESEFLSEVL